MLGNKIFYLENIYKVASYNFFIGVMSIVLIIKQVSLKIKNSIFLPKYTRYGKHVQKRNCLF